MTFNLPKNYSVPEGIKDGETFKDIATFSISKGKVTLISLGDDEISIGEEGSKSKPKGAKKAIMDDLQNANSASADADADEQV